MLTLTSEYALRAMIYITQHEKDQPILGKHIAAQTNIPAKYLSKILGDLARVGILESTRGPGGGFRMIRSPKEIALFDVLKAFEQFDRKRCPFGNQECSDANPCKAHIEWKKVIEAEQRFLMENTLDDIARKGDGTPHESSTPGNERLTEIRVDLSSSSDHG